MDVYGYVPWQCNSSDELSKQMFAQQALGGSIPFNRVPEPHAMPAPSGCPWNKEGIPWGMPVPQPQLVQFTAQTSAPEIPKAILHCKRKPQDVEPIIPAKQFITDEKMAAHLSGLHISPDYTEHSLASEEMMDLQSIYDAKSVVSERLKGHTIVLSDEIKKIRSEPLLPVSIVERLEKPCMSLVLWKPKDKIEEQNEKEDDVKTRRNGVLIEELHSTMDGWMDVEM